MHLFYWQCCAYKSDNFLSIWMFVISFLNIDRFFQLTWIIKITQGDKDIPDEPVCITGNIYFGRVNKDKVWRVVNLEIFSMHFIFDNELNMRHSQFSLNLIRYDDAKIKINNMFDCSLTYILSIIWWQIIQMQFLKNN